MANNIDLAAPGSVSAGDGHLAPKRFRHGRSAHINPNLISGLQGNFQVVAKAAPSAIPTRNETDRAPSATEATACAGCKTASNLFPFSMAFQPIVDLTLRKIDAYEALVRGPLGEGAGHVLAQVTPDNTYKFDQACRVKAIELAARLGLDRQLSINFLPNAVYEPRACIQTTLKAASRTGFPRDRLIFEIVESEAISDTAHLLAIIQEYRRHGFKVALDDFGTGYSGLARLAELRPDIVKIDRMLVRDCDKDSTRLAIIAGMIQIGRSANFKIVFEGVEQAAEVEALRSVGARYMQGFFFSKPAFEAVVRDDAIVWA